MDVVYAIESAAMSTPDGGSVLVRKGTHWPADDPLVRANPQWFAPDPRYGLSWSGPVPPEMAEAPGQSRSAPVEQVTAAPGEKRTTRRGS
jgi:hypothetical protein